jgi:serine/threonine-protein kinase
MAIRLVAGEGKSVQSECQALEPVLRAELERKPDALDVLQQMSWVQVCLGAGKEALAAAQHAVDVLPLSKDGYFGAYQLAGLAQIAAHAGAKEKAHDVIRQLLEMPAGEVMSHTRLRLDPVWDPLRQDPAFQSLLTEARP